jgi:hypothetical protein
MSLTSTVIRKPPVTSVAVARPASTPADVRSIATAIAPPAAGMPVSSLFSLQPTRASVQAPVRIAIVKRFIVISPFASRTSTFNGGSRSRRLREHQRGAGRAADDLVALVDPEMLEGDDPLPRPRRGRA